MSEPIAESPNAGQPAPTEQPGADAVLLAQVAEDVLQRRLPGLVRTLGRGAQIAGNSLGATGAALVICAFVIQLFAPGLRLNDVDYVTTVLAGTSFAVAGPWIAAYSLRKAGDTGKDIVDEVAMQAAKARRVAGSHA